jgi:Domain of unknown function (DUF4157)
MNLQFHQLPGVRRHVHSTVRQVLSDSGEPLSAGVRADLEPRFRADFSTVRVHADETANASAGQLGARAYTVGQHIVFGRNRFAPDTAAGRELLAHELTHTIQQGQVNGVPPGTTSRHDRAEAAARHEGARALAGATPSIAPSGPAIARDEGTAEVVDTATRFQQQGSVFSATMRRDQYRTHAEAQQAQQAQQAQARQAQPAQAGQAKQAQAPQAMDTGYARISLDTSTGALTIPVTVAVRAATAGDIAISKPSQLSSHRLSNAKVNEIANRFIDEVNAGLNNWFTLYVPPCQGVPFAGRELPITVQVTRTSAGRPDFTLAVSPHTGRSFVSHSAQIVVLYAGDIDWVTMRHEGAHMALGVPDEYQETDPAERKKAPLQKSDERVHHDWTLAGDDEAWGIFSVLRERHFSFVPAFVRQVLASLGHPECVPVLREVRRPQPHLLRLSLDVGSSSYGGGGFWAGAAVDTGRFLDRERSWRAFLGVHGQTFVGQQNNAFLVGARLGFERKWRSSQFGPTAEVYGESGATFETGTGARGLGPFVGAGASLGVSAWDSGKELQLKLTGGEVLRLDREGYSAFQAGVTLGLNW